MATKKVLENEATQTEVTFTFDGEDYTVPTPRKWPLDVGRAQENGKVVTVVELILGAKQMKKFESKPRTMGDMDDLIEALFDKVEIDPKG